MQNCHGTAVQPPWSDGLFHIDSSGLTHAPGAVDPAATCTTLGGASSLSQSSAIPHPVLTPPFLCAPVHTVLADIERRRCSVGHQLGTTWGCTRAKLPEQQPAYEIYFRPLLPEDRSQVEQLHHEWFPIVYDAAFFDLICGGGAYTLAAVIKPHGFDGSGSNHAGADRCEYIGGLITVSQAMGHHMRLEDIEALASNTEILEECRRRLDPSSAPSPPQHFRVDPKIHIAYILTLGVADGLRGRGLASELVRRAVDYFRMADPNMHALYLHVAAYNRAAIQFYERLGFRCIRRIERLYNLPVNYQDAFLYALSLRPPKVMSLKDSVLGFLSTMLPGMR